MLEILNSLRQKSVDAAMSQEDAELTLARETASGGVIYYEDGSGIGMPGPIVGRSFEAHVADRELKAQRKAKLELLNRIRELMWSNV